MKFFLLLVALILDAIFTFMAAESSSNGSSFGTFACVILVITGITLLIKTKEAAGQLGATSAASIIENVRASKDKREGLSEKEYARRLASAAFTKAQAREMLEAKPKGFDDVVQRFRQDNGHAPLIIPTFTYEQGLPGEYLFRAAGKQPNTVAQIIGTSIVFSESTSETYKANAQAGREIARIPASSVRRIVVVDLDGERRKKKITAKAIDTVMSTLGGGALHLKVKTPSMTVIAASVVVEYINEDGILLRAIFKVPLGISANEATKTAMERVLAFRSKVDKVNEWEHILTGASFLEDSPFLALSDTILDKIETARKVIALLSVDDPSIPVAKATAEMLALFTQNPGFRLDYVQESKVS